MPVAFCSADTIEFANAHFATILGYASVDDIIGRHPIHDIVHPEAQDNLGQSFTILLSGDVPYEPHHCLAVRRDGSTFPAFLRGQGYDTEDGRRVLLTLVDDTDEHRQRRLLSLLRRAADAAGEPLIVVRSSGHALYANRAAETLFEAESGTLFAHDTMELMVDAAADSFVSYHNALAERGKATGDLELRTLRGRVFPARVSTSYFDDPETGETLAMATVHDLTAELAADNERKLREKQLALMLREAHHRIKNTLQVATDILTLQSLASDLEAVRTALQRAATRIRALSAVHEGLSTEEDVTTVALRPLIRTVVGTLRDSAALTTNPVAVTTEVADIRGTSRQASALALIATELVTNSMTHTDTTLVRVEFAVEGPSACLVVTDQGSVDILPDAVLQDRKLGLQLVALLAEEQLHGTFEITRAHGVTAATVRFPRHDSE